MMNYDELDEKTLDKWYDDDNWPMEESKLMVLRTILHKVIDALRATRRELALEKDKPTYKSLSVLVCHLSTANKRIVELEKQLALMTESRNAYNLDMIKARQQLKELKDKYGEA